MHKLNKKQWLYLLICACISAVAVYAIFTTLGGDTEPPVNTVASSEETTRRSESFSALLETSNAGNKPDAIKAALEFAQDIENSDEARISAYVTCYFDAKEIDDTAQSASCMAAAKSIAADIEPEQARNDWLSILDSHENNTPIDNGDSFE